MSILSPKPPKPEPPPPPIPVEDDGAVDEVKKRKRLDTKRTGRKTLRITPDVSTGSATGGLRIPT